MLELPSLYLRETLSICVGSESVAMSVTGLLSCHKETVRFVDWHVLLSPLSLNPLFTCGFNCGGNPLRFALSVLQPYIQPIKPISVQIKEIYTGKVTVKNVSVER